MSRRRAWYDAAAKAFLDADEIVPNDRALVNAIAAARRSGQNLLVAQAAERAIARHGLDVGAATLARDALTEAARNLTRIDVRCAPEPCTIVVDQVPVSSGPQYFLPGTHDFIGQGPNETRAAERLTTIAGASYRVVLELSPVAPEGSSANQVVARSSSPQPKTDRKSASSNAPRCVHRRGSGSSIGKDRCERLVAIKRVRDSSAPSKRASARFLDEARMTAQVHHANVVGLHHTGIDEEGPFLIFDYVEGESVHGLLRVAGERGGIPARIVLRIALDALAGLNATHEATDASGKPLGILHRDVSPPNILVGCDGVSRLADFGIAKSSLSSVVTDEGYVQGKLHYMAPEYIEQRPINRTVDVYAMGVTLWTAFAGTSPWANVKQIDLVRWVLAEGVPPLWTGAPDVGPEIAAVIARACERNARARFQTAREMLDALDEAGKKLGAIAGHVEVAEYVTAVAGDSRRDGIHGPRDGASGAGRTTFGAVEARRRRRARRQSLG